MPEASRRKATSSFESLYFVYNVGRWMASSLRFSRWSCQYGPYIHLLQFSRINPITWLCCSVSDVHILPLEPSLVFLWGLIRSRGKFETKSRRRTSNQRDLLQSRRFGWSLINLLRWSKQLTVSILISISSQASSKLCDWSQLDFSNR